MVYNVYKPVILQRYFRKRCVTVSNVDIDRFSINKLKFGRRFFKTYYQKSNNDTDTLLIWFHGGCFMEETPKTTLPFVQLVGDTVKIDVLTFDYPLPFDYTLDDTFRYINKIINTFLEKSRKYSNIFFGGDSAGAFLATKTMEFETNAMARSVLNIDKLGCQINGFIGICGLYDTTFSQNRLGEMLFKFYVLRGCKNHSIYQNVIMKYPMHVQTSTNDFLIRQTQQFYDKNRASEHTSIHLFKTSNSTHCFITITSLPETIESIEMIKSFIYKYSKLTFFNDY